MTETPERPAPDPDGQRIFLVVVDDTDEWVAALHFACRRALHTGGRVALLHVIEPVEFQHWMSVGEVMREERRQEAEQLLQRVAKQVNERTGTMPELHAREGTAQEQLLALIDEQPSISVLVLGASTSSEGPGPLVQYVTTRGIGSLRIPITIVPGNLSEEEIDKLA
ncbi:MAG: universal stress protein [Inquilinus sp.]|nr:universal stress protein [Inquilinus sp.]